MNLKLLALAAASLLLFAALDSLTPQIRALKKAGVQAGTAQCGLVEAQEAASAAADTVESIAADAQAAVESAAP